MATTTDLDLTRRIARLDARRIARVLGALDTAERDQEIAEYVAVRMEEVEDGIKVGYVRAMEDASERFSLSWRQVFRIYYGH